MKKLLKEKARPTVLIADDDRLLRMLGKKALEQAGFSVREVSDGNTAVSAFLHVQPDIVLLDIMMPEKDGFSVCQEIRGLPQGEFVPILILTGLEDLESLNRAYEVGATDFIIKPINWTVLGHHVRYMLRANSAFANLKKTEAKNTALLSAIPDLMFRINSNGIFMECKQSKQVSFLVHPDELLGKSVMDVFPKDITVKTMHAIETALLTGIVQEIEYQITIKKTKHYFESRIVRSGDEEVLAIIRDISDRKNAEKKVIQLAYYDYLTGLPNRVLFRDRMEQAALRSKRSRKKIAVMFLDLDNFKNINDTLGHSIGDLLLKNVANRLSQYLRKTDSVTRRERIIQKPTLARIGGDEFTILIHDIDEIHHVAAVARRILNVLSQQFTIGSHEIYITGSIGITIFPTDSEDVDTLLKYADTAMHCTKEKEKNNFQFYTESMNAAAVERYNVEHHLRKALLNDEFRLYYQPQVDTQKEEVIGVEGLIRWVHPEKGLLLPNAFIPLAEETSLILSLGKWVIASACSQYKNLHAACPQLKRVSVNISNIQLREETFPEAVMETIRNAGIEPQNLELEITESCMMDNIDETIAILRKLRHLGIHVSIDDFGTGYSSLNYLNRLPISILKIDRSFVKDIEHKRESRSIVRALIALAGSLDLKVIAEGVETEQQRVILQEYGCNCMQGFLFSKPVPVERLMAFFQESTYGNNKRSIYSERGVVSEHIIA